VHEVTPALGTVDACPSSPLEALIPKAHCPSHSLWRPDIETVALATRSVKGGVCSQT